MDLQKCYFIRLVQLCVCLSFTTLSLSADPRLKSVSVLYRHGDRSPVSIYPKDKNQVPGAWPDGLGWLTNIGKKQHYELGQFIRNRYSAFINTTRYHQEEIKIESSGYSRCLMSAYSNLAGLFPPSGDQEWHQNITWQPIPVQSSPIGTDKKLAMHAKCPKYDYLMNKELTSPVILKEEQDNKDFYDMIVNETNVAKESIRDIWAVSDALICERANNMTWNSWAHQPGVWDKLDKLATWSFDLLYGLPEMAKLKGGPLLSEIVNNMEKAVDQTPRTPKFHMYSGHDTTVAALLSAMQVWREHQHQPRYCAMVMVELYQVDTGHEVKVFYKNSTEHDDVYQLTPPGCGSPCSLDNFTKVANQRIPIDWESECQVEGSSSMSISPVYWLYVVILAAWAGWNC